MLVADSVVFNMQKLQAPPPSHIYTYILFISVPVFIMVKVLYWYVSKYLSIVSSSSAFMLPNIKCLSLYTDSDSSPSLQAYHIHGVKLFWKPAVCRIFR